MNTPEPAVTATTSPPTKHRIMVVDDDDQVRSGLRGVLIMEGYDVVPAANGREAIVLFRESGCDLALLDMNMPVQNGWCTIGDLRALRPGLPVIFITARPDQRTLAREVGVDLMEKPLDLAHLLERIRQLLEKPANAG